MCEQNFPSETLQMLEEAYGKVAVKKTGVCVFMNVAL
jgi:hypothetical protein